MTTDELTPKEQHVKEKIEGIDIAVDCDCIDRKTRKVLTYLIDKELKFLGGFPRVWVEGTKLSLESLKEQIEKCTLASARKPKEKRELTDYQRHMQNCIKEEKKEFSTCVGDWNESKV